MFRVEQRKSTSQSFYLVNKCSGRGKMVICHFRTETKTRKGRERKTKRERAVITWELFGSWALFFSLLLSLPASQQLWTEQEKSFFFLYFLPISRTRKYNKNPVFVLKIQSFTLLRALSGEIHHGWW